MEETIRVMLELGYEHNRKADQDQPTISVKEALMLVNDTADIGTGRAETEPIGKLEALLQRCEDDDIRGGVDRYIQTQPGIRNETATQISRNINRAARECQDGPSVLNNRSPVIDVSGLMTRGEVTVITSGQNRMGNTAAGMLTSGP